MKKLQQGRSMIEMLGVLAIIGVLSIGGLAGYTMAMNRHRANQILDYVARCGVVAQTDGIGETDFDASGATNACADLTGEALNASLLSAATASGTAGTDLKITVTYATALNSSVPLIVAERGNSSVSISTSGKSFCFDASTCTDS